MTFLFDPDPAKDADMIADRYVGSHRNPDDVLDDPAIEGMQAWLDSLGHADEPAWYCPDPDVHRGLFLASETTWRLPSGELRALLDSPDCCWCGSVKV